MVADWQYACLDLLYLHLAVVWVSGLAFEELYRLTRVSIDLHLAGLSCPSVKHRCLLMVAMAEIYVSYGLFYSKPIETDLRHVQ